MTWLEHHRIMRLLLIGLLWLSIATSHGASLAGQQVQGGGKIEIRFPVARYFQDIAAQAGAGLSARLRSGAPLADPRCHFDERL